MGSDSPEIADSTGKGPAGNPLRELAWVDGRIVGLGEAFIPIEDRGVLFGEAVYEALLTRNGRAFARDRHLTRLARSARGVGLDPGAFLETIAAGMDAILAAGGAGDGLLYLQVSGGVAPRDHLPPRAGARPLAFMTLRRFDRSALRRLQERGCAVITHPDIRWPRATYKTTQLLPVVLAKRKAEEAGAYEVIFIDGEGQVLEGGSSNFFVVTGGRALTASDSRNILPGITRQLLLEQSHDLCVEAGMPHAHLADAEEAFITSTTRFVLPVIAIDGRPVGDGRPGPLTRELAARLDALFEADVGPRSFQHSPRSLSSPGKDRKTP